MLEFITDKYEPVECHESVEVIGIIHKAKTILGMKMLKKILRGVIKQTTSYVLCGKFELTVRTTIRRTEGLDSK